MGNDTTGLQERKLVAVSVIVFGAILFLYHGIQMHSIYKYLVDILSDDEGLTVFLLIYKILVALAGLVFILVAKIRALQQTAWKIAMFSSILLFGIWSLDLYVVAAAVLLFVGVVLYDKTSKLAAVLLVVIEMLLLIIRNLLDANFLNLGFLIENMQQLDYQGIVSGIFLILSGVILLVTRGSHTRESSPLDLTNRSENGKKSVGIIIIYGAIYLIFTIGLHELLNRLFLEESSLKTLLNILIPAGLIPFTALVSRKHWPSDEKWSISYEFLVDLLYISAFALISAQFKPYDWKYTNFAPFILLCMVCALVLILKENRPKLAVVMLVIAFFNKLIIKFFAAIITWIKAPDNFNSIFSKVYDTSTFNTIFISVFALGISLVLGIVLLVRSKIRIIE